MTTGRINQVKKDLITKSKITNIKYFRAPKHNMKYLLILYLKKYNPSKQYRLNNLITYGTHHMFINQDEIPKILN